MAHTTHPRLQAGDVLTSRSQNALGFGFDGPVECRTLQCAGHEIVVIDQQLRTLQQWTGRVVAVVFCVALSVDGITHQGETAGQMFRGVFAQ